MEPEAPSSMILALNAGSSSIKFSCFAVGSDVRLASGKIDRIGMSETSVTYQDHTGTFSRSIEAPDHVHATEVLFGLLAERIDLTQLAAVGHRVVHGMDRAAHARIDDVLLADLRRAVVFAPEHLPHAITLIEAVRARFPELPQVAVFDTVFHHAIPEIAQTYAIPKRFRDAGIRRYGFHGISYAYLMDQIRTAAPEYADGRIVLAHLGNGASMCAVHHGKSVDTTMGFTPLGGLPMGTRSGDLDPGVVLAMMDHEGLSVDAVRTVLNHESGLLALSGTSAHMWDLLQAEAADPAAHLAVEQFVLRTAMQICAYGAVLDGIDLIVFSGGMGEVSAPIRSRITARLRHLGVVINADANERNERTISTPESHVRVMAIPTDEEVMIAKTAATLSGIL